METTTGSGFRVFLKVMEKKNWKLLQGSGFRVFLR